MRSGFVVIRPRLMLADCRIDYSLKLPQIFDGKVAALARFKPMRRRAAFWNILPALIGEYSISLRIVVPEYTDYVSRNNGTLYVSQMLSPAHFAPLSRAALGSCGNRPSSAMTTPSAS